MKSLVTRHCRAAASSLVIAAALAAAADPPGACPTNPSATAAEPGAFLEFKIENPLSQEDWIEYCRLSQEGQRASFSNDFETAAARLAEAVARLGGRDDAFLADVTLNNLAWALHQLGRDAEALPYARRAVEASLEPTLPACDTLGCVLLALGETDEARRTLEEALRGADAIKAGTLDDRIPPAVRTAVQDSRDYLRLHLAQCLDRAGDAAGARALLDALRGEGFVPGDPPERAAYEALAERLGAAPLAPPPPPPPPAARFRFASLSAVGDLVGGAGAAVGRPPRPGVPATLELRRLIEDVWGRGAGDIVADGRPVHAAFWSDADGARSVVAVPGGEIPQTTLARLLGGRFGFFRADGWNFFVRPDGNGLAHAATGLVASAAEPRLPFAAAELALRPAALRADDGLGGFLVEQAEKSLGIDLAALERILVGVGFDEADGLLVGLAVAPAGAVPDAPPLDPAAILYREGSDLNFAASDLSLAFAWAPDLYARAAETTAFLDPRVADDGAREDAERRRARERRAAIVGKLRAFAAAGASSCYYAAAPTGGVVVSRGRIDLRTPQDADRLLAASERLAAIEGADLRRTADGWTIDFDYPNPRSPEPEDARRVFGNRHRSERRLVPGTAATYDGAAAAPGLEIPPPAGAPDFGPFSRRFGGLVPSAHLEIDLAAWAPLVAAACRGRLPDGLPDRARATFDLAFRDGEALALLRLDPDSLRLLDKLFSLLSSADAPDAGFDD